MSELSWLATKRKVHERAQGFCEYCQTSEEMTGQAMHVEHIDPVGGNVLENLCLSCATCNLHKAVATHAIDPETNSEVNLFDPRTQKWSEHFEWIEAGLRVKGKTAEGRVTIARLKINHPRVVRARSNWMLIGKHPPSIEE